MRAPPGPVTTAPIDERQGAEATPQGNGASGATETVDRPAPGTLARGAWEAPPWAFYAGAVLVVIAAVLYTAARAGLLRRWAGRGAKAK